MAPCDILIPTRSINGLAVSPVPRDLGWRDAREVGSLPVQQCPDLASLPLLVQGPLEPQKGLRVGDGYGTNQKCKSRKRSRETERSAMTRNRVGGVLSGGYHSCLGARG
ncbi:hypothetical protein POM88_024032 [Heracleum sosnowskyi]|uniref:Uncharacterized protein n=1 Tax=Heracleum sosnowskyi TaxID=360622 RepID=A0AAD8MVI1_9APIA|nr:hypothetical protein POM88_024032 [Heracleum sosnowskyi]